MSERKRKWKWGWWKIREGWEKRALMKAEGKRRTGARGKLANFVKMPGPVSWNCRIGQKWTQINTKLTVFFGEILVLWETGTVIWWFPVILLMCCTIRTSVYEHVMSICRQTWQKTTKLIIYSQNTELSSFRTTSMHQLSCSCTANSASITLKKNFPKIIRKEVGKKTECGTKIKRISSGLKGADNIQKWKGDRPKRLAEASAATSGGVMTERSSPVATAAAALNFSWLSSRRGGWEMPWYVSPVFLRDRPFISRPLTRSGGGRETGGNKSPNCFAKGGRKLIPRKYGVYLCPSGK